jgi:hypothetical protein
LETSPVTVVVPRSADGAEGWTQSAEDTTVVVPRTADGAERRAETTD